MREMLVSYLTLIPCADAAMMAAELGLPPREVQDELHRMDDDGDVIMSLGWYRLSEAKKMRLGKPGQKP